jgi:hypothetical protein
MPSEQPSFIPFRQALNAITTSWQNLMKRVRDPYRPELHYMRGPGPKWHAKHSIALAIGQLAGGDVTCTPASPILSM